MSVGKASINMDWLPLIRREISIATFDIANPAINLKRQENGRLNLITVFSDDQPKAPTEMPAEQKKPFSLPFNIKLNHFTLINGKADYADVENAIDITLNHIGIQAQGDFLDQKGSLHIGFSGDQLNISDHMIPMHHFNLSGTYDKGDIALSDVTLAVPGNAAVITGHIQNIFKAPSADIQLELDTELAALNRLLGFAPDLSGRILSQLRITGPIGNPEAHLKADYENGTLFNFPVDRIELLLDLKDRTAILKNLSIHADAGTSVLTGTMDMVSAFPNGFLDKDVNLKNLAYDLTLDQENIRIEKLFKTPHAVSGEVSSHIRLFGKGINPADLGAETDFTLSGKNIMSDLSGQATTVNLNGNAKLKNRHIQIDRVDIDASGFKGNAHGDLDLSTNTVQAAISVNAPDVHPLLVSLGIENTSGSITVASRINGLLSRPVFDLMITTNQFSSGPVVLGDLKTAASLELNGILKVSELYVKNQAAEIYGSGNIQLFETQQPSDQTSPMGLTAMLNNVEPRFFYPKGEFGGIINGRININKLLAGPDINVQSTIKDFRMGKFTVGDLDASLHLQNGILTVKQIDISNKNSKIRIHGNTCLMDSQSFHPLTTPSVNLAVRSDKIRLNDFTDDVKGDFSIAADISGPMDDLTGSLSVKGSQISLYRQEVAAIDLAADLKDKKLFVHPLKISIASDQSLVISGWVSQEKTYALSLTASDIPIDRIAAIKDLDAVKGTLFLDFAGSGSFDQPQLSGTLKLTQVKIRQTPFDNISLDLTLEKDQARASGNLNFPVEAAFNVSTKAFSLNTVFTETDLSPYFLLLDSPQLGGHLSGNITLSGTADKLSTYRGDLNLDILELRYEDNSIISGRDIQIALKDEEMRIRNFNLRFPENGLLSISGKMDQEHIALSSNGSIPLSVAGLFIHDLNPLSGRLSMTADVHGAVKSPDIYGEVHLENIGTALPYLNQTLHDTNARIKFTHKAVVIEALNGKIDDGQFDISGRMDLHNYRPGSVNGAIRADQMALNFPGTMDLLFNSSLAITGDAETSAIKGDVILQEGVYYKDVNLNLLKNVGQKKRKVPTRPKAQNPTYLDKIGLNIAVKHRQPFVVDNNLSYMEILPDLKVTGTAHNPIINGRTQVQSGEVFYQKKTFTIQKGIIDFLNPYKTEATIDINADTQIRDWKVGLDVSGTPDDLEFKLDATPYLDHADILSLIIFGRTSTEMAKGEGGSDLSASQMLFQFVASSLNKDIQNVTGLDVFKAEVQTPESGNGTPGVKVTVGEELSKRMTVLYSVETTEGELIQQAIAEYKLLENLLFSSFQDNQNAFGGQLKYKLEFR